METFLTNTNTEKLEEIFKSTDSNVEYFEGIVRNTVEVYSKPLDEIMKNIYSEIISVSVPPLNTLEKYFLELSNCLYFMGDKLESLGTYDVLSKEAFKEVYNKEYLELSSPVDSKKKPTVAELTATAENNAQYENIVNNIYNKAYKILKNKIDSASTMLSSINKIISKRLTEMQLNSTPLTGRQILNEDFNKDSSY